MDTEQVSVFFICRKNSPVNIVGLGTGVGVFNLQRDENSPWAAKIISRHTGRERKHYSNRLCLEAKVLSSLDHPNIIGYRAFVKRPDGREVCICQCCKIYPNVW